MASGNVKKLVRYSYGNQLYDTYDEALHAWQVDTLIGAMEASTAWPGEVTPSQKEQFAAWALHNAKLITGVLADEPDIEGGETVE